MTLINESGLTSMGSRYKAARQLAGLRQEDVAHAAGVTRQAVSDWEKGLTEPSASKLVLLARATKQPLDWFAEGLFSDEARPKGLEPLTFWLGARQGAPISGFWTPARKTALLEIECQLSVDSEFFAIVGVE